MTKEYRISITTITGKTYVSAWTPPKPGESLDDFENLLDDFTLLRSLNLTPEDGVLRYFNPPQVESVGIEER